MSLKEAKITRRTRHIPGHSQGKWHLSAPGQRRDAATRHIAECIAAFRENAGATGSLCVCLNVLVLVVVFVGALYLDWAYTPPSSDVLPLPATLTVVRDRNQGCPGGPV